MRGKNWFWGAFFVIAAVLIVAGQVTSFATLGFWSIVSGVFLAACLISSLVRLNFVGTFLSAALLYIVFQTPLSLFYINPWLLILAALFAGGGLSMIVRRKPRYSHHFTAGQWTELEDGSMGQYPGHGGMRPDTKTDANDDDNHPYSKVSFGATSRYLHSTAMEYGQFISSFGTLDVFFDQAQIAEGGAEIFCDSSFGAIRLFVPRSWIVEDRISTSMGGVSNDIRMARPEPGAPKLVLTGNAQFGSVEVQYV